MGEKQIMKLENVRSYLFWGIEKIGKGGLIKAFNLKSERDNWISDKEEIREKISSNSPLICKARRSYVIDKPCEIPYEN